jgi:hypothetical protein
MLNEGYEKDFNVSKRNSTSKKPLRRPKKEALVFIVMSVHVLLTL